MVVLAHRETRPCATRFSSATISATTKEKEKVVQEVRIGETCQVNLFGNIQLTTQAIQALCEGEVPIAYFSMGGWFYGVTQGLGVRNVYLRRDQFRLADVPSFCLRLARMLVSGKIRNQRTMLQRNHVEPPASPIAFLKCMGGLGTGHLAGRIARHRRHCSEGLFRELRGHD